MPAPPAIARERHARPHTAAALLAPADDLAALARHEPTPRVVRLRWSVSGFALAAALPSCRTLASDTAAVLELLSIEPADAAAPHPLTSAQLLGASGLARVDLASEPALRGRTAGDPSWMTDPETGLDHIDVPGLLHATFRPAPGAEPAAFTETASGPLAPAHPLAVLYARTPLFELLGIRGGRYELLGGELRTPTASLA